MYLSNNELDIIMEALGNREARMFRDYEAYLKGGNNEAAMDCMAEMRKARDLRLKLYARKKNPQTDEELEEELAGIVREKGEQDGNIYRMYLSGLYGECNLDGHTDIVCAHLGEDGKLTFQVNTPDDDSCIFVYLSELPYLAGLKAIKQMRFWHDCCL